MNGLVLRLVAVVACLAAVAVAVPIGSRIGAAMRGAEEPTGPYRVVVSIPPLKSLVQGYFGESSGASVDVLIPPGTSEHGFEIPPSKLAMLARADLVVIVGLGMEPQVEKFLAANPRPSRRVIRFADVVGVEAGHDDHHDHEHDHGHDHEHDHGTVDPHLWLDPSMVVKLVEAIGVGVREDLIARGELDGDAAAAAWVEKVALRRVEVEAIDGLYRERLSGVPRRTIVVGHDAWGHLAGRYDLETVAIKGLTANEPTPAAVQAAIETVRSKGLTTIFVERQLSKDAGRRIAQATGAKVAELDPLGDGDWAAMMTKNLEALVAALTD